MASLGAWGAYAEGLIPLLLVGRLSEFHYLKAPQPNKQGNSANGE